MRPRAGIDPDKIFVVSLMPCVAKKDECVRPQMRRNGKTDQDIALTTREFARLLRKRGVIDWDKVTPPSPRPVL